MATTPVRATLSTILQEAGVPAEGLLYLQAKGINTLPVLAYIATDEAQLIERVIQPFIDGIDLSGHKYTLTGDEHIWKGSMLAAWEDCCLARKTNLSFTPPASSASSNVATLGAMVIPQTSEKIPATLTAGVWKTQIDAYENSSVPKRDFPKEKLIGAEGVLARMLHEAQVSHMFTPIKLGELLQNRSFTATGTVNQIKTKDKVFGKFGISDDGQLELAPKTTWDPQSQWAVIDGLEAVLWALVFCSYGTEVECNNWTQYFVRQARNRSNLESVKHAYDMASWRLALSMRSGDTFANASRDIIADTAYMQEQFTTFVDKRKPFEDRPQTSGRTKDWKRPAKQDWKPKWDNKTPAPPPPPSQPKAKKGKGQGKGKGKDSGKKRPSDNSGTDICDNFNEGKCTRKNCRYLHNCSNCNKPGHAATDCWNKP